MSWLRDFGVLGALAIAAATFLRTGAWRRGEHTAASRQALDARLTAAERWHESPRAAKLIHEVRNNTMRLNAVELLLPHCATKEDVERLHGEVRLASDNARSAADGVQRVYDHLLEHRG